MKTLLKSFLGLIIFITNLWAATSGISVTVRNWKYNSEGNYYDGDIYRCDIQNGQVTSQTKLISKPASQPHISPDGKRLAFLQNSHICVMDINGGTITQLAACKKYVSLDFPNNNWIFWSNGTGSRGSSVINLKDSSGMIYRVNANNGANQTPELVVTLHNTMITRWNTDDPDTPTWWKVDLGQPYNVTGTQVIWQNGARNYKYTIETSSDNTSWSMAVDKSDIFNTAQIERDDFTASNVRYVRITITNVPVWSSFFDFQVFSGGVNVALNKPASALSSQRGHPASYGNDTYDTLYPIAEMGGQNMEVDASMSKICFHPNGPEGALPQFCYTVYFMSAGDGMLLNKHSIQRWSCGGGMSCDGIYLFDGKGSHTDYDIRLIDYPQGISNNGSVYKEVSCPNQHWYDGSGGATNSPDWICRGIQDGNRQSLFNWRTGEQIITGSGHGGDFWIGTQSQDPVIGLSPASCSFAAQVGVSAPAAQTIQISNNGSGTLNTATTSINYTDGTDWLAITRGGSGNSQTLSNAVSVGALDSGTYRASVTVTCSNAVPTTASYSVTLHLTDPNLQLGSVVVSPAACTTHTWATVPFTAVAKTTNGSDCDPQPSFKWTISDGQIIDSTNGTFRAGSVAGGLYSIIAATTVGAVTKRDTATVLVTRPLTLSSPVAGTTYRMGDTLSVIWVRNESCAGLDIQFSSNGGITYNTIIVPFIADTNTQIYNGTTGTFKWKIPATFTTATGTVINCVSTNCKIRLYGPYDSPASYDYSGVFTIGTTGINGRGHTLPGNGKIYHKDATILVFDIRGRLIQKIHGKDLNNLDLKDIKASGVWIILSKRPGERPRPITRIGQ